MVTKKKHRQITLHFGEDTEYILDEIRNDAKKSFRTTEQQMVFALSAVIKRKNANKKMLDRIFGDLDAMFAKKEIPNETVDNELAHTTQADISPDDGNSDTL